MDIPPGFIVRAGEMAVRLVRSLAAKTLADGIPTQRTPEFVADVRELADRGGPVPGFGIRRSGRSLHDRIDPFPDVTRAADDR